MNEEIKNLAPIILFVYNRPWHTQQTLHFLAKNHLAAESEIFIFADGAKNNKDQKSVSEVREIIKNIQGFKSSTLFLKDKNKGLAESVIDGVNEIFKKFNSVIVMEDDLESTPDFLTFINLALKKYENEKKVFSISGYSYPLNVLENLNESAYFSHRGSSWSWATWRDRWETVNWEVDKKDDFLKSKEMQIGFNRNGDDFSVMLKKQLNGEIDSWAIRFAWAAHLQNKFHLLASSSKINNIGQDNSGTHSKKTTKYLVNLKEEKEFVFPVELEVKPEISIAFKQFFKRSFLRRVKSLLTIN